MSRELWFLFPNPNHHAKVRFFCFPYAGAGASVYYNWKDSILSNVDLAIVQYPGRENRIQESPYKRISQLVHDIAGSIVQYCDMPYIFFGHSLGALIAFELSRELRRKNHTGPLHLFVSGMYAPQKVTEKLLKRIKKNSWDMSDSDFVTWLSQFNGTSNDVLQNEQLLKLLLPVLRADMEMLETYEYIDENPLNCSITAYNGLQDTHFINSSDWCLQTINSFRQKIFPGDHFFIQSSRDMLMNDIIQEINTLRPKIDCESRTIINWI